MDFIARSGRLLDRAYRVAGLLLVFLILETVFMFHLVSKNSELNQQYRDMREKQLVYVVPGAKTDFYSPSTGQRLLDMFVEHILQSYHTHTYASVEQQLAEIKKFYSPVMMGQVEEDFERRVSAAKGDQRSTLFVPERKTIKVKDGRMRVGNKIVPTKEVTLRGHQNYFLSDSPVLEQVLQIKMIVYKTNISRTNPFGYLVAGYQEKILKETGKQ